MFIVSLVHVTVMTRYARAKGSKSSNERVPNEATPWHVMKQQLLNNSADSQVLEKSKSAKELLNEDSDLFYSNSVNTIKNDWAEFENNKQDEIKVVEKNTIKKEKSQVSNKKLKKLNKSAALSNQNKNNNEHVHEESVKGSEDGRNESNTIVASCNNTSKLKSDYNENMNYTAKLQDKTGKRKKEIQHDSENNEIVNQPQKRKKHKKHKDEETHLIINNVTKASKESCISDTNKTTKLNDNENNYLKSSEIQLSKRQKRNLKKKNSNPHSHNDFKNISANKEKTKQVDSNDGCMENKDDNHAGNFHLENSNNFNDTYNKFGNVRTFSNVKSNKRRPPKIRDNKEHKRRKPDLGSIKITINGIDVEIVKYDGFPVKKEDAERLHELKQKMIMKGIPKSEVDTAMKLERRKAEKALTRLKKCVCFHCRKSGHNLSDCPELGNEQAATGICFKCGSTEHTHFECKVTKSSEYRYAVCFICHEQGHITKQCPDNPKGIYPQGGACKVCGDVTHLKKDCPDLLNEKQESTITVDKIAENTLELLEEDIKKTSKDKDNTNSKNKIVKF